MNAPESQDLIHKNLEPVRNRVAFHFSEVGEIGTQLNNLKFSQPVFVSGLGSQNAQVYYELADFCAMSTFTQEIFDSPEALWRIVEPLVKKTSDLTIRFITNAETFLARALEDFGMEIRRSLQRIREIDAKELLSFRAN